MAGLFNNEAGFSLVETLVATVVFALVSAAGVMLLSGYQDGRLGLQVADDRLAELETARALLRMDMMMAVDRPVRDALGGGTTGFEGGSFLPNGIVMRFVRSGDMGALMHGNKTALQRIDYRLEGGALVRRSYAQTDITLDTPSSDITLLSNIETLNIRYEAEGIWVDEWGNSSIIAPLPKLAEFKLQFKNGRDLDLMFLVGGGV